MVVSFVLLALPAALVPRGVGLDWCLCGFSASCCAAAAAPACCGEQQEHDGPVVASGEDCACCKQLEVDDFDEAPTSVVGDEERMVLPALAVERRSTAPPAPRRASVAPRAPPVHVTPSGLLPGARPLLL